MKIILTIVLLTISTFIFSQAKITQKVGSIELIYTAKTYKVDTNDIPLNKIDRKKTHITQRCYYDSSGKILKKIYYGNYSSDWKVINYIYDYSYIQNKRICNVYKYYKYHKRYELSERIVTEFNSKSDITTDSTFYFGSDTSFFFNNNPLLLERRYVTYQYLSNPRRVIKKINPNFYVISILDSLGRTSSQSEIYNGKKQSEVEYFYVENSRISHYSVHDFSDSSYNYLLDVIEKFNKDGLGISMEKKYSNPKYSNKLEVYSLYENGIRKRIDYFEMSDQLHKYLKTSVSTIKIKSKVKITKSVFDNIIRSEL